MTARTTTGLRGLRGVGPAIERDLHRLGVRSVGELAAADPDALFVALRVLEGGAVDPCVLDVFRCAVAQARDPALPAERRNWWWSRARKDGRLAPVPRMDRDDAASPRRSR